MASSAGHGSLVVGREFESQVHHEKRFLKNKLTFLVLSPMYTPGVKTTAKLASLEIIIQSPAYQPFGQGHAGLHYGGP